MIECAESGLADYTPSNSAKEPQRQATKRRAKVLHEASLQGFTVVLGALMGATRSNDSPRREADRTTTSQMACGVRQALGTTRAFEGW
jgi:hypothetical protein